MNNEPVTNDQDIAGGTFVQFKLISIYNNIIFFLHIFSKVSCYTKSIFPTSKNIIAERKQKDLLFIILHQNPEQLMRGLMLPPTIHPLIITNHQYWFIALTFPEIYYVL